MVYDSDFYTTRRTYTRPSVSSYTVSRSRYYPVTERPHMHEEFDVRKLYSYAFNNIDNQWDRSYHQNWHPLYEPLSSTYRSHLERRTRWSPGDVYSYSYDLGGPRGYYENRLRRLPYSDTYRYYSHLI